MPAANALRDASMRPLHKYLLLQVPGWLLTGILVTLLWNWQKISAWLGAGFLLFWVAKDLLLYPLLREAYRSDVPTGATRLVGRRAVVRDALNPRGYVRVRGESWRAELLGTAGPLAAGAQVRIVSARGLTLIVEPESVDDES
jgi:membrane protein implicated in regulation of membrane protease activity